MRTEFLCISVLRVASGHRVKLVSCKSALNPPVVYSNDRSKAVVPVLVLLCCFVVNYTRRFVLCLTLCYFVLVFFSPFSIAFTSLGEERANLSGFCTFVRFVLVWYCWFPLPLGVWEGLRFVIVAFPGLFSYLFLMLFKIHYGLVDIVPGTFYEPAIAEPEAVIVCINRQPLTMFSGYPSTLAPSENEMHCQSGSLMSTSSKHSRPLWITPLLPSLSNRTPSDTAHSFKL